MKIDGKQLAQQILDDLKQKISPLNVKPTLAVIQVGDDEGSTAYINQKKKKGEQVGITVIHKHFSSNITQQELTTEIRQLNSDSKIQGIIIQRPLPAHISTHDMINAVAKEKDVDGFRQDSPLPDGRQAFTPPVALAVLHILNVVVQLAGHISLNTKYQILNTKKIVILGRGETAGKPIARTFEKLGIPFSVIHSQTTNRTELLKSADIVISCAGRGRVVTKDDLKPGVILIGVGISRINEKLSGDYDEEEIKETASYYTPTPGGVGPLTVAFLLQNLLQSAA